MKTRPMTYRSISFSPSSLALVAALSLALSACAQQPDASGTEADEAPLVTPEDAEAVSILRPEIEPPEAEPTPEALAPYRATIGFPKGGKGLSEEAKAVLEAALNSPQMALGLPITLGAHSDSAGSDEVNLDSSQERGLAVAKWLIDNGVAAERITVIAFGEQNPIEPNALPSGAANEAGRAANRRVEIEIEALSGEEKASEQPVGSIEAGD